MSETFEQTWNLYASAWGPIESTERTAILEKSVDNACEYKDPVQAVSGVDDLTAYMEHFQEQVPGGGFQTVKFRTHNDRCMVQWDMVDQSGTRIGDGISYGEFDQDGLLTSMNGFFDTPNNNE